MRRSILLLVLVLSSTAAGQGGDSDDPVHAGPHGKAELFAPTPRDGFTFAVYGDRTGGPVEGLDVLRRAVVDTNLFDPDFVMTVGDLVNGYNEAEEWIDEMREYKSIMNDLAMPWFPVAGNHDVYGRGGDRGDRGNLARYADHFGPLWYSFDHGTSHFVVLFSDEALSFQDPRTNQNVSAEQMAWLREDLAATRAGSIFLFLHHPRWTPTYEGSNWPEVHEVLVADGRVRAVFAGHLHRYRYDEKDGIRYYTLATVGAYKGGLEEAGDVDHFNLVTVRGRSFQVVVVPVGQARPGDFVLGEESEDAPALQASGLGRFTGDLLDVDGSQRVGYWIRNPTRRPIEYRLAFGDAPARLEALAPFEARELLFEYPAGGVPPLAVEARYVLASGRVQLVRAEKRPAVRAVVPLPPMADDADRCLHLDGVDDCARIDPSADLLPTGPFTLELWVRPGPSSSPRSVIVAKTELSAYGLFLDDAGRGQTSFFLHAAGRGYAGASTPRLAPGVWTHVAATWDQKLLRLFVAGQPAASVVHPGDLTPNDLPLFVGADPDPAGAPGSFFQGDVDELRMSAGVRYPEAFQPARRHEPDTSTILLLHFDELEGDLAADVSGRFHHARLLGEPERRARD